MLTSNTKIEGFLKIIDIQDKKTILETKNAIHYENMSIAIAQSLAREPEGYISKMVFGNGGSIVSGTGTITYFPPNISGLDAQLYNQTYEKIVDEVDPNNTNPLKNKVKVKHVPSTLFTDIIINCVLELNEPSSQNVFDDNTNSEDTFVFDEIGIKSYGQTPEREKLLTHAIFSPVEKSLNRQIEIIYTIRISMC
ncbi:MAG: hypothetical protein NZZ41_00075 [Candidatus Dojkabacteria bacterium]|nr:hypothetical protein [Candidatus Dojkabacteria bacterium]